MCGALSGGFSDTFLSVVRNPKTTSYSPQATTLMSKSLTAHRTLQHICKAHKTSRTKPTLQKSCNSNHTANSLSIRQTNKALILIHILKLKQDYIISKQNFK
jgi:hypothetical protein